MNRLLLFIAGIALAVPSTLAVAQDATARTVQYHSQDIVPIRAKLKYTTLIEVPPTEKIMEAATGDKDFWVVDVVGNFCFVHPAKAGISSNLNLITDKGNIYSFTLQDVSGTSRNAGLEGSVPARRPLLHRRVQRTAAVCSHCPTGADGAKLAALQSHVGQAVDEYKSAYQTQLKFDYASKLTKRPSISSRFITTTSSPTSRPMLPRSSLCTK